MNGLLAEHMFGARRHRDFPRAMLSSVEVKGTKLNAAMNSSVSIDCSAFGTCFSLVYSARSSYRGL
jgi:hypothetical protein